MTAFRSLLTLTAFVATVLHGGLAHAAWLPWDQETQADCPERNIENAFHDNRNQTNMGWCYANVTADLLDFYFHSELSLHPASAAYVGLAYNQVRNRPDATDGGYVSDAFHVSFVNGNCPGAGGAIISSDPHYSFLQKIEALSAYKASYDASSRSAAANEAFEKAKFISKEFAAQKKGSPYQVLPENEVDEVLANSNEDHFVLSYTTQVCHDQDKQVMFSGPEPLFAHVTKTELPRKINPAIKSIVESNRPVAIYYIASFLQSPTNPTPVKFDWFSRWLNHETDIPDQHVSLIIGQHWDQQKNRCEWIVRNSWGGDCTAYPNKNISCVNGNLYIDKKMMEGQMFSAEWVKNR